MRTIIFDRHPPTDEKKTPSSVFYEMRLDFRDSSGEFDGFAFRLGPAYFLRNVSLPTKPP